MKGSTFLSTLLVVVLVSIGSTDARRRRSNGPFSKKNGPKANSPVCREILASWWEERREQIRAGTIDDTWDETCVLFSGYENTEACQTRGAEARAAFIGDLSINAAEASEVACASVGAHNEKCIANPCNQLNNGDCTLEKTGGLCVWYTKADRDAVNPNGAINDVRVGYGCYRNPCHDGGNGRISDNQCLDLSVKKANGQALHQCTKCSGRRDKRLRRTGMGCQIDQLHTSAECERVKPENVVNPSNIFAQGNSNNACQCIVESPLCKDAVDARDGNYVQVYP